MSEIYCYVRSFTDCFTQNLDVSIVAGVHLRKILLKDKILAANETLQQNLKEPPQFKPHNTTANVVARLCNAKAVKNCVNEVKSMVRATLGIENASNKKPKRAQPANKESPAPAGPKAQSDSDLPKEDKTSHGKERGSSGQPNNYHLEDEAQLDEPDDRVSDDSPGEDNESSLRKPDLQGRSRAFKDDEAFSYSDSRSVSPVPDAAQNSQPSSSAFLPALTMGGYWSGSESDGSEADDQVAQLGPRKNRRGQRARRQIWEWKYGHRANHVKYAPKSEISARDEGWDMKKGAQETGNVDEFGRSRMLRDKSGWDKQRRKPGSTKSTTKVIGSKERFHENKGPRRGLQEKEGPKKKVEAKEGPLHPSWEAAKKRKSAGQGDIHAFAGKKMTFD